MRRFVLALLTVWMALTALVLPAHVAWVELHTLAHAPAGEHHAGHDHTRASVSGDASAASAASQVAGCLDECCTQAHCAHSHGAGMVATLVAPSIEMLSHHVGTGVDAHAGALRPRSIERPKWKAATLAVAATRT